jgi:hypothetical protein
VIVRVVGSTLTPPPTVVVVGSNCDAPISFGVTVGVPETPVELAKAGAAQSRQAADTASSPSKRNLFIYSP